MYKGWLYLIYVIYIDLSLKIMYDYLLPEYLISNP